MKIVYFVCVFLLLSTSAYGAGTAGVGKISYLYQRSSDGLLGVHKQDGLWDNPDGCQKSDKVVITRENKSRAEFYTALLTAKTTNKDIQPYVSDCIDWNGTTYPLLIGLFIY